MPIGVTRVSGGRCIGGGRVSKPTKNKFQGKWGMYQSRVEEYLLNGGPVFPTVGCAVVAPPPQYTLPPAVPLGGCTFTTPPRWGIRNMVSGSLSASPGKPARKWLYATSDPCSNNILL